MKRLLWILLEIVLFIGIIVQLLYLFWGVKASPPPPELKPVSTVQRFVGPIKPPEAPKPPSKPPVKEKVAVTTPIGEYRNTKASYYDYSLKGSPNHSKTNLTAASNLYPRGSNVEVCAGEKCIVVKINDYGPNPTIHPDRALDLSSYAFKQLGSTSAGILNVKARKVE